VHRSVLARLTCALLVVLYAGAQPALLCAVDCALGRHGVHETHAGHHHGAPAGEPCHTGQITGGASVSVALSAVTAAPPTIDLGLTPTLAFGPPAARENDAPASPALSLDPPPPRG
jgi:hypothetical protein